MWNSENIANINKKCAYINLNCKMDLHYQYLIHATNRNAEHLLKYTYNVSQKITNLPLILLIFWSKCIRRNKIGMYFIY